MVSGNISPRGGLHIIKSLSSHILELNLENNLIGKCNDFISELAKKIQAPGFVLQSLNLSNNGITDEQVELFFNAFIAANNKSLRKIWFNRNFITDRGVMII